MSQPSSVPPTAKRIHCLGNLRQMGLAAQVYTRENGGFCSTTCRDDQTNGVDAAIAWDLTTLQGIAPSVIPGLLWLGQGSQQI